MPLEPERQLETAVEPAASGWAHKLWRLIFIVFCFELGVFLMVFPWLDYWDNNFIATLAPWIEGFWSNLYFRGAVSGLGVVNIYISLAEVFRLRRPPADKMKLSSL